MFLEMRDDSELFCPIPSPRPAPAFTQPPPPPPIPISVLISPEYSQFQHNCLGFCLLSEHLNLLTVEVENISCTLLHYNIVKAQYE